MAGRTQALDFSLDIQEKLQERGQCMSDEGALRTALKETLPAYPGCAVSDVLTFSDGSIATLTTGGFIIE